MKRFFTVSVALLMVMCFALSASAAGIIYIITPSASNPFFGTEQRVGAAKAKVVEGPYIHHVAAIHGDIVPVVYEACKYIGVKPDLYDPIEDKVKAYLHGEDVIFDEVYYLMIKARCSAELTGRTDRLLTKKAGLNTI